MVYVYECKQDVEGSKDKKKLVNSFYFSGLYPGKDGNDKLWNNVQDYINKAYDTEYLKKVFISGDGASWIKSGADILDKALFCADKFHLMKYINHAAAQMLDEKDIAKEELWHLLYSKKPKAKERFEAYTNQMIASAKNPDKVEELKKYVLGNWEVYGDEETAKCLFCKYKHCREVYMSAYGAGRKFIDMLVSA